MKKNKALKIVLICILVSLGVGALVFYLVDKDLFMKSLDYIVELLNKPLPIVGITTIAILGFVWQLIVNTNYGKAKLILYDNEIEKIKQEKEQFVKDANSEIVKLSQENEILRQQVASLCELSTNVKINNFGKELANYGKEIDSDTKEE